MALVGVDVPERGWGGSGGSGGSGDGEYQGGNTIVCVCDGGVCGSESQGSGGGGGGGGGGCEGGGGGRGPVTGCTGACPRAYKAVVGDGRSISINLLWKREEKKQNKIKRDCRKISLHPPHPPRWALRLPTTGAFHAPPTHRWQHAQARPLSVATSTPDPNDNFNCID